MELNLNPRTIAFQKLRNEAKRMNLEEKISDNENM